MRPAEGSTRDLPRWLPGLLVLFFGAWAAASAYEASHPPKLDSRVRWVPYEEAKARTDLPQLFVFSAAWCEPCINFEQETLQDEGVLELLHRETIPVLVTDRKHEDGVNAPEVAALVEKYGVTAFPTLVLQPPGGGAPRVLRGFQRADALEVLVKPPGLSEPVEDTGR